MQVGWVTMGYFRHITRHKLTKLSLFEPFALPVLTYGLDAFLFMGPAQIRKLNVCWNSIYMRIFNFHRWESVKVVQLMCERLDLTHILDKINLKFYNRLYRCDPIDDQPSLKWAW